MEKKLFARYPLGNPRRIWRQENYVLAIATPGPTGLDKGNARHLEQARRAVETSVDAGFNQLELLWASPAVGMEIVKTAERLGTNVIFQDLRRFGGMGFAKEKLNENNDLMGSMRDTACWKSIVGYYVFDEPINDEQRKITREMIDIVERERPGMLACTVCTAGTKNINKLADDVDPAQLCFDTYPFGNTKAVMKAEDQLDCSRMWYSMEIAYRAAKRIGAPFWFYYQGHELFYHPRFDRYTFAASRMMANAAILYGAKGISSYVEMNGVLDSETGGHGYHFEEQKELNQKTAKLGNTLMALECLRVIHDDTLAPDREEWPEVRHTMEDSELLTGTLAPRFSVSEHADNYGHRYLMVLNRDYRLENHYCLTLKQASRVYRVSAETGCEQLAFENDDKILGHLEPGGLVLYRIQAMEEEPYTLEYYLEKRPQ